MPGFETAVRRITLEISGRCSATTLPCGPEMETARVNFHPLNKTKEIKGWSHDLAAANQCSVPIGSPAAAMGSAVGAGHGAARAGTMLPSVRNWKQRLMEEMNLRGMKGRHALPG